jgi:hypothetical protein
MVKIRKSLYRHGRVKLYGEVQRASSARVHRVVRIRVKGMKRWLCDCESFLFTKAPKRRHCFHLHSAKKAAMQRFGYKKSSL